MLLVLVSSGEAQVTGQPYRLTDREVARLLDRIRSKTNTLRDSLKKALNKSRLDRIQREENSDRMLVFNPRVVNFFSCMRPS